MICNEMMWFVREGMIWEKKGGEKILLLYLNFGKSNGDVREGKF